MRMSAVPSGVKVREQRHEASRWIQICWPSGMRVCVCVCLTTTECNCKQTLCKGSRTGSKRLILTYSWAIDGSVRGGKEGQPPPSGVWHPHSSSSSSLLTFIVITVFLSHSTLSQLSNGLALQLPASQVHLGSTGAADFKKNLLVQSWMFPSLQHDRIIVLPAGRQFGLLVR